MNDQGAAARLAQRAGWRAGWEAWPWHVLEVAGGREAGVRDALAGAGLPAVTPMHRVACRRSRRAKVRDERIVPMLPGYVFAGVAGGDWDAVRGCRDVRRVVAQGGAPARVRVAELLRFLRVSAAGAGAAPAHWQGLRGGPRLVVGGRAEVLAGPMAGWLVDVAELRGLRAVVITQLLGGRRAEIALDDLAAA